MDVVKCEAMSRHSDGWSRVAGAISTTMRDINMRQADLVRESGLSDATVRSFMTGRMRAEPSAHTIRKLEEGLLWPPGSVERILAGEDPASVLESTEADVDEDLVRQLDVRLVALEGQVKRLGQAVVEVVRATTRDASSERKTLEQLLELLPPPPEAEAPPPTA